MGQSSSKIATKGQRADKESIKDGHTGRDISTTGIRHVKLKLYPTVKKSII